MTNEQEIEQTDLFCVNRKIYSKLGCLLVFCCALISCNRPVPKIYWTLPNGDTVIFYHSQPTGFGQSDHWKNLDWIEKKGGIKRHFQFGGSHSGYSKVALRMSADESVICLLDLRDGLIGAVLNLNNKSFQEETVPLSYYKEGIELLGVTMSNSRLLEPE